MKKVMIEIDTDGSPIIKTLGFKGPECKRVTKPLENELGVVISDQDTAEMHMAVPVAVKAGGGVR